jgi:putative transposase
VRSWRARLIGANPMDKLDRVRARERAMKRFTSAGHAQRFLSAFSGISPHFRTRRHLLHAQEYRCEMANRFSTWNEVTGLTTAA